MSGNLKKVCVFDEDQSDLLPAEGAVVSVEISCVRNPSHFYVILPWGPFTIQEVASNSAGTRAIVVFLSLFSFLLSFVAVVNEENIHSCGLVFVSFVNVKRKALCIQVWTPPPPTCS